MKNKTTWILGAIAVVLALWWMYAHRITPAGSHTPPITVADPSTLSGIQTGEAPWTLGTTGLAARLAAINLPQLTMEGQVLHIHQHLDLFINGESVAVPANIGINAMAGWLSSIHVHDATGIIHVESPYVATFTLGQFFDVWGVLFTSSTIGGYTADATHSLRMYVNGVLYEDNPRELVLAEHQEIAIIYGTNAQTPTPIPASYTFPAGY